MTELCSSLNCFDLIECLTNETELFFAYGLSACSSLINYVSGLYIIFLRTRVVRCRNFYFSHITDVSFRTYTFGCQLQLYSHYFHVSHLPFPLYHVSHFHVSHCHDLHFRRSRIFMSRIFSRPRLSSFNKSSLRYYETRWILCHLPFVKLILRNISVWFARYISLHS